MTERVTSINTKRMFAEALKRAMATKPLSKVTVSELVADCGVNRKTFYYHFEDVYALLTWTLEQEAFEVVRGFDLGADLEGALTFILDYVDANHLLVSCTYDSLGRDLLKRFFEDDLRDIVGAYVRDAARDAGVRADGGYLAFVTQFYVEALAGMLIDYVQHPEQYARDQIVSYLAGILVRSVPAALG